VMAFFVVAFLAALVVVKVAFLDAMTAKLAEEKDLCHELQPAQSVT
jgi:hypothetical protein